MADFVELRPGMRVMVPSPKGVIAGYFSSTVRRVDGRGVLIDIPRLDGEDLPLKSGQTIQMFVQLHGRMYEFESRIHSVEFQVLLEEPDAAKLTERRSFFRLLFTLTAEMTLLSDNEDEDQDEEPSTEEVAIVDLSGGGARVRTSFEVPIGTQIALEFLIEGSPLRLMAEVVRSTANETARRAIRYEAHCRFTQINRSDEDRIVRFVFQKQREFSKRGVA